VVRGWDGGDPGRGIEVRPTWVFDVLERTDWLEEIRSLAADGRIQLRVADTFAPEQAAEAQRVMDAGGLRGRVVIVFD
jgi:NADPH:quinone reductase